MRIRIGCAVVRWHFDLPRIRNLGFGDASREGRFSRFLQQLVDFRGGVSSMMDMGFHGLYFCSSLFYVIAKIANIWIPTPCLSSLSASAVSNFGLLFSQLLLLNLEDMFFFFGHGLSERRIFPSRLHLLPYHRMDLWDPS